MAQGPQEYIDKLKKQGMQDLDVLHQQRQKNDDQTIADVTDIYTKAAQSSADGYQHQIDAAPGEAHADFAKNELQEALGRQRAELKMANMGMTDSGLSETSQAALSVQRANANADVRRDMQKLVSGLEKSISDVWAERDAKVATDTANIRKSTADWYTQMAAEVDAMAQEQGTAAYNAEQEAAAAVRAAEIEAAAKAEEKRLERLHDVNLKLLDSGVTIEDVYGSNAAETNTALYGDAVVKTSAESVPDMDKAETVVPDTYRMQWNWGDRINVDTKGGYQGIVYIAEEVARQLEEGNQKYVTATEKQKKYAVAKAAGLEIKAIWGNSYKNNNEEKANVVRAMRQYFKDEEDAEEYVDCALLKAGIDPDFADNVDADTVE